MHPLISIIMPIYNSEKYISDAIDSVILQSYENWELILVDDCSTDLSLTYVKNYLSDSRIKLFKNTVNSGPAITRNVGLNNASGDYITFLDSDDFWDKEHLYNQVHFMLENGYSMTHGNYHFCNLDKSIIKSIITDEVINYSTLLKGNQFKIMTVMIERSLLNEQLFLNEKHEDYILFLNVLKKVGFSKRYTSNIDSYCRIGKVSVSSNKFKSALWTWYVYRKSQKLSFLSSVYYFINYAYNGFMKYR